MKPFECISCSGGNPCDCGKFFKDLSNDYMVQYIGYILQTRLKEDKLEIINKLKERFTEIVPQESKEDIHLFLLSSTPFPGIHGKSFRIRSEFNIPEREVLQNSHCKDIKIIIIGEAEGEYWCRLWDSDEHSYVPPECFEFPWIKGNI